MDDKGLYARAHQKVIELLPLLKGEEFQIEKIWDILGLQKRKEHTTYKVAIGTVLYNLSQVNQKPIFKQIGKRYKVIQEIKPVRWWEAKDNELFNLSFPYGHEDDSHFGFEDLISISPGDLIVISGVSNTGKSALALNILGENIDKHPCVLMGNEYTALGGEPSSKFKGRMLRMKWVKWFNDNGEGKFDLLPIRADFEDHIVPDKINIIDWINLTDQFYKIGLILEDIKAGIGKGIAVVVLQKEEEALLGRGKGFTRDLADVYFTIDPFGDRQSRLSIQKVKAPKGKVYNRHWAFKIVDDGANLLDIREVTKCSKCWGRGYTKSGRCENCSGKGFLEKNYREKPIITQSPVEEEQAEF